MEGGPGKATGADWEKYLYRQERMNPPAKKMLDTTNYPLDDPRGHVFAPRPKAFADSEGEWVGIRGHLDRNRNEVLTKEEVLTYARERGVKLEERRLVGSEQGLANRVAHGEPDPIPVRPAGEGPAIFPDQTQGKWGLDPRAKYEEILIKFDRARSGRHQEQTPFVSRHHFPDDKDLLVHLRKTDRPVVASGAEKAGRSKLAFHIEEIQGDLPQKGKKEGYASERLPLQRELEEINRRLGAVHPITTRLEAPEYEGLRARKAEILESDFMNEYGELKGQGVPDAPFKKTSEWVGLAVRRGIEEAVSGNYDRISWSTGEQVADLNDLRKEVSEISYDKVTGRLQVWDHSHHRIVDKKATKEELAAEIGRAPSEQLLAQDTSGRTAIVEQVENKPAYMVKDGDTGEHLTTLLNVGQAEAQELADQWVRSANIIPIMEGDDLVIGGSGMIEFYNRIVPNAFMKELKKYGAVLEPADVVPPNRRHRILEYEGIHPDADVTQGHPPLGPLFKWVDRYGDDVGSSVPFKSRHEAEVFGRAMVAGGTRAYGDLGVDGQPNLSIKLTDRIRAVKVAVVAVVAGAGRGGYAWRLHHTS